MSGPHAKAAASRLAGALPDPRMAVLRDLRDPVDGRLLDSALLLRFDGPRSATGEDVVEFQCHGGRAVIAAILDALTSCDGVRLAVPGEFTRRALINGRIDLTEAEGLADLLEAETETQRRAALALASGGLSRQIEAWRSRIVDLSARAEAAIDYVGEEDETGADMTPLRREAADVASELTRWLERPRAEPLKQGLRVVIAGPPNAGKSSLINTLSGQERAIVLDTPGTTRDSIEVPLSLGGVAVTLIDTAGLRDSSDRAERIGVGRAQREIANADVLLWLGAPTEAPAHLRRVVVQSKADLSRGTRSGADLSVSSVTGENISALLTTIEGLASELLVSGDGITPNQRQAKAIEDAAASLTDVPHDIVLLAESFRSARDALDRVTGRVGIEDTISALFGRFCLGK